MTKFTRKSNFGFVSEFLRRIFIKILSISGYMHSIYLEYFTYIHDKFNCLHNLVFLEIIFTINTLHTELYIIYFRIKGFSKFAVINFTFIFIDIWMQLFHILNMWVIIKAGFSISNLLFKLQITKFRNKLNAFICNFVKHIHL